MSTTDTCQKLVVVLGRADPVLESTLTYVGLQVVHTAGDVTVWAPLEWKLAWRAPAPDLDRSPAQAYWDDIPWASADYPCNLTMEDSGA